jgi:hypothetical protein
MNEISYPTAAAALSEQAHVEQRGLSIGIAAARTGVAIGLLVVQRESGMP